MSVGVIFFFLMLLSFLLNKAGITKSGYHANRAPLVAHYAGGLSLVLISISIASAVFSGYGTLLVLLLILSLPMQSYLAVKNGWVRYAYYLGRLRFLKNVRDGHGGPLFVAWRALQNTAEESYEKDFAFIKNRINLIPQNKIHTATLLVSCFISNSASEIDITQKLMSFGATATKRVPMHVADYCYRFCLAATLKNTNIQNWETELNRVSIFWQSFGLKTKTRWVIAKISERDGSASWFQKLILKLRIGKPVWANQIFSALPAADAESNQISQPPFNRVLGLYKNNITSYEVQDLVEHSSSQEFLQKWSDRAVDLGCFDPKRSVFELQKSITDYAGLASQEFRNDSDVVFEKISHLQRQLDIQIHALSRRPILKKGQNSVAFQTLIETDRWITILNILIQLDKLEPESRISIYFQIRDGCWNWMADLWNTRHYALGYWICNVLFRLAGIAEDGEAKKHFRQVLSGECR